MWLVHLGLSFKCGWHIKLSDNNKLSDYIADYNFASKLKENTEVYEPITFEEILIVMINDESMFLLVTCSNTFQHLYWFHMVKDKNIVVYHLTSVK